MSLTGNEDHSISLQTASEWTANFRDTISSGDTIAHYFGRTWLLDILAQEGCVGIRIYYALDEEGKKQLVLTGVNSDGNDLYNGILAEKSLRCPTNCSSANPLNSNS